MTIPRAVQLGLIAGTDKAVGPMPGSVFVGTNADLIAKFAPLYLTGSVVDVTYGKGAWWRRHRPARLVAHDIKLDGVDFRALPEADKSADSVCYDPPQVPRHGNGYRPTPREVRYREAYGLEVSRTHRELLALHAAGLAECERVARRWVLVKCCDFTNARNLHLVHVTMIQRAAELGLRVHDLIIHHTGPGPGGDQILEVKRARRHHSYLIVFRKPLRKRRIPPGGLT